MKNRKGTRQFGMVEIVLIACNAADVGHEGRANQKHGNPYFAAHGQPAGRKGMLDRTNRSLDRCSKVDIGGKNGVHSLTIKSGKERPSLDVQNVNWCALTGLGGAINE